MINGRDMNGGAIQLRPISASNLRDQVEQRVRDAILDGTFLPGQRLVESTIADQLGVSRAPLREVFSALGREGLMVNIPRRGNFVVDFTDKDIDEIYSLRLLLEVGALRWAITRFSAEDLAEMQALVDRLGELTAVGSAPDEVVRLDLQFHAAICRAADNGRLFQVWDSMRAQTRLLIGLTSRTHYQPGEPRQYHQAILDAIQDADLPRAEKHLSDHIIDARRRACLAMRQRRSLEEGLTLEDEETCMEE
jgi:DNA-binding GntR family transcriptional regulator